MNSSTVWNPANYASKLTRAGDLRIIATSKPRIKLDHVRRCFDTLGYLAQIDGQGWP